MKRIFFILIACLLCWSSANAAQVMLKTDSSPTQERSVNTEFGVQNTMNTELYTLTGRSVKTWLTGVAYTTSSSLVANDGSLFTCTSTHTAGSTTEPGVGASWQTVWTFWGVALYEPKDSTILKVAEINTQAKFEALLFALPSGGGSGDITEVVAGDNLSGGGAAGSVTLGLDTATQNRITANDGKISYPSSASTKLAGIDEGATVNSPDTTLLDRTNHTGTQPATTISDFDTEVANNATVAAKLGVNPNIGNATGTTLTLSGVLTAESLALDPPPSGSTGEMYVQEDPDNGTNLVGFKAPSALAADLLLVLPDADGIDGQVLATDGAGTLGFVDGTGSTVDLSSPGPIGGTTPSTATFTSLTADDITAGPPPSGSTGEIGLPEDPDNGTNLVILKAPADLPADRTIIADALVEWVAAPTVATGSCIDGQAAKDASFLYVCQAADTWLRVAIATW